MVTGIVVGAIVWLIVVACVAEGIFHDAHSSVAFTAGTIAAVWTAMPFIKHGQIERYNTLFPVPKRYQVPWKNAFAKVREILARASYKMGHKWNVTTADTTAKHIHATLQFSEEEFAGFDGSSVENIRRRTEVVKRFLEVDIQFKEEDDACVIQLDFSVQVEGTNPFAADPVIDDIKMAIDRELGAGTPVGNAAEFTLEAPPWWLLAGTGLMLLSMFGDVWNTVFK